MATDEEALFLSLYESFDGPFSEFISMILNGGDQNPTLMDLPPPHDHNINNNNNNNNNNNQIPPPMITWDSLPIDPNIDPALLSVENNHSFFEQGNTSTNYNNNDFLNDNINYNNNNNNGGGGGNYPMLLQNWPPSPVPFNCSCCQVLREIIHVNELLNNYMKLEIHGRLGMICHALCETKFSTSTSTSENPRFQMFDFCRQSIEEVKKFLVDYCSERKREGYVMINDPLATFYEALCVGLEWDDFPFFPLSPLNSGDFNFLEQEEEEEVIRPEPTEPAQQSDLERNNNTRMSLAQQRQRTGRLTLMDLRDYLHLTIEDAAKAMNVCPTVLKKICRKSGLHRWPYRKIRSITRKIESLRPSLESYNAEIRAQAQAEIDQLRQEAISICGGVDVLGLL